MSCAVCSVLGNLLAMQKDSAKILNSQTSQVHILYPPGCSNLAGWKDIVVFGKLFLDIVCFTYTNYFYKLTLQWEYLTESIDSHK